MVRSFGDPVDFATTSLVSDDEPEGVEASSGYTQLERINRCLFPPTFLREYRRG